MLVKRFELVGSVFHTGRPWSDVVNARNGMVMKLPRRWSQPSNR